MTVLKNWAGNYTYQAKTLHKPECLEEVQTLAAESEKVKVLGTRHSFNAIADTPGTLISFEKLNRVIALDPERKKVTVEAGIRYGDLCQYLHKNGFALHNLASLPHISVAGACATATHGSGDRNPNLASAVHALEIVKSNGETAEFSRDQADGLIDGAIVGLGALGAVTKITLDIVPEFQVRQDVYEQLPLSQLEASFDDIFSSAYSVSLFTDWKQPMFNQIWLKRVPNESEALPPEPEFFGAVLAGRRKHPVQGVEAANCSEQMGKPGPSFERLPHFRMEFTPSKGEEIQSEYIVPRQYAYAALCAIERLRASISPLLYVCEVRTIAEDHLWMSPCCKQASVGIHFTWKPDGDAVRQVLPAIEAELEPYQARPHWGKVFTMPPARVQSLYEKLPDFRRLVHACDPNGKFRNAFLDTYILAN